MGYFRVALKPGPAVDEEPRHAAAHVKFIELIERHLVFLGGDFTKSIDGIDAAYLLSCKTLQDAEATAAPRATLGGSSSGGNNEARWNKSSMCMQLAARRPATLGGTPIRGTPASTRKS